MEIDLDNLRVFISRLNDFAEQLQAGIGQMQNDTEQAHGIWNDTVFQQFLQTMEAGMGDLLTIVSAAQTYEEHLEGLYADGVDYLEG